MTLKEDAAKLASELFHIANDREGFPHKVMSEEIENFAKKYVLKIIAEYLSVNNSDTAHFQAMGIFDKVLGK